VKIERFAVLLVSVSLAAGFPLSDARGADVTVSQTQIEAAAAERSPYGLVSNESVVRELLEGDQDVGTGTGASR
jgi:hypothetical protein